MVGWLAVVGLKFVAEPFRIRSKKAFRSHCCYKPGHALSEIETITLCLFFF